MEATAGAAGRSRWLLAGRALTVVLVMGLAAAGLVGAYRYVWTFWLYRGFPAPELPPSIVQGHRRVPVAPGTIQNIEIKSPAVGLILPAIVYLPPGYYSHPNRRYPTMYFLHGVPGSEDQFVDVGDVQTVEAVLVARHLMPPTILVIPQGATDFLQDTEWANLPQPHAKWMTYVARDVVGAIDRRYRTIDRGTERAIAGLSEGGYGAFNIALHHPREFGMVESWSGYVWADAAPGFFGRNKALDAANSPAVEVRRERSVLLADHVYFWFYVGTRDYENRQNVEFDAELSSLGLPHWFFVHPGVHDWRLWRSEIRASLLAAGQYFTQYRSPRSPLAHEPPELHGAAEPESVSPEPAPARGGRPR
jgi:enterochelin esterase-like enzyme